LIAVLSQIEKTDKELLSVLSTLHCPYVLGHSKGEPSTARTKMKINQKYINKSEI